MTTTEALLFAAYGSAVVRLDDICVAYLQLGRTEAIRRAGLNRLPFPTFRLTTSQKAPIVLKLCDLADHIDRVHGLAQADWEKSQV